MRKSDLLIPLLLTSFSNLACGLAGLPFAELEDCQKRFAGVSHSVVSLAKDTTVSPSLCVALQSANISWDDAILGCPDHQ